MIFVADFPIYLRLLVLVIFNLVLEHKELFSTTASLKKDFPEFTTCEQSLKATDAILKWRFSEQASAAAVPPGPDDTYSMECVLVHVAIQETLEVSFSVTHKARLLSFRKNSKMRKK